ncbi:MAG: hypothetical protein VX694_16035 [Planctomycetota bacterium]|nr:hypothetical protein [Planctomycetota bacterium]
MPKTGLSHRLRLHASAEWTRQNMGSGSLSAEKLFLDSRADEPNEDPNERQAGLDGARKSRIAGRLFAGFALLFFVLINLPFRYVEVDGLWLGHLDLSESQQGGSTELPVMGGWPWRYAVAYENADALTYRDWAPASLFLNVLVALSVCTFLCWFLPFRQRSLSTVVEGNRRRIWFDGFFAISILVIPSAIIGLKGWQPYQQRELARQLSRNGNFYISAWVPEVIEPHLPQGIKNFIREVRHARLTSASVSMVERVVGLPSLVSLHSYQSQHSPENIQVLTNRLHFNSLLIADAVVNDEITEKISQLRWLQHLKFQGTPLSPDQFHQFDALPLITVDLQNTGLTFRELDSVDWSKSCELLWLSRQPDGVSDSLKLTNWPKLESLSVKRRTAVLNREVLGIHLENLPSLRRLYLDRVQKHDLILLAVPRLATIQEEIIEARFVADDNYVLPGLTWVRNFEIDGADSLSEVECYATDLETLRLGDTANLKKLKLGAFKITLLGNVVPQQVDQQRCQQWIQYLGARQGPYELDFGFLPLHGVDLSPLSGNFEIRDLKLNGSYVAYSQLREIGSQRPFNSLDARTVKLEGEQFVELLDQFSEVDELMVEGSEISSLEMPSRDRLKLLRVSPMSKIETVTLVDQPRLRTSLQMLSAPDQLRIENIPGLVGLSVEGPWPDASNITGLRDLEWFAGGGPELEDKIADQVLQCAHLHRLTFAYPSITPQTLRKVGQLEELVSLALPGTPANDEIVGSWANINDLWEANFDDTDVGAETIIWLTRMSSLRRVSLNRIHLDQAVIQALTALRQICELHLESTQIPNDALAFLLQKGHLEVMNLTGWKFDEELMKTLESHGSRLSHLIVRDGELDSKTFRRLMNLSPRIFIDVDSYPDDLSSAEFLSLHQRADQLRRQANSGWRLMLQSPQDIRLGMTRDEFLADRERRVQQRQAPWMPKYFSLGLRSEKFKAEAKKTF